jgi:hypothetical protein
MVKKSIALLNLAAIHKTLRDRLLSRLHRSRKICFGGWE